MPKTAGSFMPKNDTAFCRLPKLTALQILVKDGLRLEAAIQVLWLGRQFATHSGHRGEGLWRLLRPIEIDLDD
jgi:hypothetical protein